MKSFAPSNEQKFGTVSQTRKHQITWPIGNHILPSFRGKATSFFDHKRFLPNFLKKIGPAITQMPVLYSELPIRHGHL